PHTSPIVSTHTCRFTPVIFFSAVESARTRLLGSFHRLTVGDPSRGLCLAPLGLANHPPQSILDAVPGTIVLPLLVVPEGCVPVRKLFGQSPPSRALPDGVDHGVQQISATVLRWPSARLVGRHERFEDRPLLIREP